MNPRTHLHRIRHMVALAMMFVCLAAATAAERPNVVIFLADDAGWGDFSLTGNSNVKTPNIDSLGKSGAILDRFYVCAVCAPTRAEMLTGRYHSRGGVRGVSLGQERLNPDEKTIADTFKAAGYRTGLFGKWHNGSQWPYHPNARGFDEFYGFTSGHWGEYFDPLLEHNGQFVRGKGYITDDLTDRAVAFIEQNRAKPFFCYIPYNVPHSPFCVPDEYWDRFKNDPIKLRGKDGDRESVETTRCALAMVENMDWNIGRVLKKLDELRLTDKTIVIFFSDNGPNSWRWNGGMKGKKGTTDEGGVRSLFCLRWPAGGIKAGTTIKEISGAIDLLPTLASLARVPVTISKPLDGLDVSPLLLGTAQEWPERMIFSHQDGKVSARSQQYRLDNSGALFDMSTDPQQTRNVAKENPAVAAKLSAAVTEWRHSVFGTRNQVPENRPYPVGYPEFPMTPLPARDGVPHGSIERSAAAPNCSYFTHWRSTNDAVTWDIEVHTAGTYEVGIYYTCPQADTGATVDLTFKEARVDGKVAPGWDPPLWEDQDRVPRKGESFMKDFRLLKFGAVKLDRGRGLLTLKATDIPGQSVMDLRLLTLTLRKP